MAEASDKKGILLQNLEDAGCSREMIQDCMGYVKEHKKRELLQTLASHKKSLLDTVHGCYKQIDCLDYLIYRLDKEQKQSL